MEEQKKFELFEGKSLSDLFKDIYNNNKKTKDQIKLLVNKFSPLIKSMNDIAILAPVLKDYIDVAVKSDDQLVKLADIVQRLLKGGSVNTGENGYDMNSDDWKQLTSDLISLNKNEEENKNEAEKLTDKNKVSIVEEKIKKENKIDSIEKKMDKL